MIYNFKSNCAKYVICLLIGLLLGTFLKCEKECVPDVIEIEVPGKSGDFDIDPKEIPSKYRDSIVYRDSIIFIENPVDPEVIKDFEDADDFRKGELYIECKKQRVYQDTVSDDNLKIYYTAKTTGTLDEFKLGYEIFPQKIEVEIPTKPKRNEWFYGGSFTSDKELNQSFFSGGILMKTKKDVLYQLSINSNKSATIGTYFKF